MYLNVSRTVNSTVTVSSIALASEIQNSLFNPYKHFWLSLLDFLELSIVSKQPSLLDEFSKILSLYVSN